MTSKRQVKSRWEKELPQERGRELTEETLEDSRMQRFEQHPYLREFAEFHTSSGDRVLEIGVGTGIDFQEWAGNAAKAVGVDLTKRAVNTTKFRLQESGVPTENYRLLQSDAEHLPFSDDYFDRVYSFGVLHHTPDTYSALEEVYRVTASGGGVRLMLYSAPNITGFLLWLRFGLLRGRPLASQKDLFGEYVESPGTKAFTEQEIRLVLTDIGFDIREIDYELSTGNLLLNEPPDRMDTPLHRFLWKLYPRPIIKRFPKRLGSNCLIKLMKPNDDS